MASDASATATAAPPPPDIEDLPGKGASAGPPGWPTTYAAIRAYRSTIVAPVDVVGCHILGDRRRGPKTYRFQTLVALMLSAQTRDQTTGQAMRQLRAHFGQPGDAAAYDSEDPRAAGELGDAVATAEAIDACISKVGFHVRKAEFIRKAAGICAQQYDGDIPDTLEGLVALPGVGPKMAFLALQAAWGKNLGIGVDTHVHRISNRLGWVHTKQPEETRRALEAFLPMDRWAATNPMLVGFGQTTCLPQGPRCAQCPVHHRCPASSVRR
ncbi:DNA glycosylase [Thamnocephalis sphaerospora]|uniref:Endonuclease III homolog n=1 Tax=Thamnocephalis sphaerospora TaxID=78915 RepID=A0A4P9XIV9_9FUNG|nr:DNA glycosylase [Thamnocephalis sphaerospora]|eukprot:RKP05665.1 DNA glycosylase [Thamnocephalis sphaerospora]